MSRRERASVFSLVAYVIMLFSSCSLLSVPGDYWPWYAGMACFTILPILLGPNSYRVAGVLLLVLAVLMIFGDINAGKRWHVKMERIMRNAEQQRTNNTP